MKCTNTVSCHRRQRGSESSDGARGRNSPQRGRLGRRVTRASLPDPQWVAKLCTSVGQTSMKHEKELKGLELRTSPWNRSDCHHRRG